jgi:prepilin-type N-terminal cleavage/methylation domain-containing protein
MTQRGFTLIEMMIVFVIIVTVGMIALGAISGGNSNISMGINGMTESRCIEGYKFIVSQDGGARQILDEFGKGAKCSNNPDPGKMGSFGSTN